MLNLILADTELETIPPKLTKNDIIRKYAKRKNKPAPELILDSNYHHPAMKTLQDSNRRGRPDIPHYVMLTALDSALNKSRNLNLLIHTRNNFLINTHPATQLPQSYNRFIGLMEDLFKNSTINSGNKTLLTLSKATLPQTLSKLNPDATAVLDPAAPKTTPSNLASTLSKHKNPAIIIGGFSHGTFRSDVSAYQKHCIDPEEFKAWSVTTRLIYEYEDAIGLPESRLNLK